jgi:hypothetical protein
MTNKQINIAIAEAVGWEGHPVFIDVMGNHYPVGLPPDYCNDLNAMHEAEKVLTSEQIDKYVTILCLEIQPEPKLHHATAQQRAEAFLRTIGKWEE